MENTIQIRKKREFGEIFNVVFLFIRQEIKTFGPVILYFVLPICIVIAILSSLNQWSMMKAMSKVLMLDLKTMFSNLFVNYLFVYILTIINQVTLMTSVYSYVALYAEKGKGNFAVSDVLSKAGSNFVPLLGAGAVMLIMILVGTIMCILPGIYLSVSLSLVGAAMVIERKRLFEAISRSFDLTHIQWWWTFLLIFVTIIILSIISYLLSIPVAATSIGAILHGTQHPEQIVKSMTTFSLVYGAIISVFTNILYVIPHLALAFQYFNLVETKENTSLLNKIEQISNAPQG
jgi:hypothetical protein